MDKRFLGCFVKAIDEEKREIYARASVGVLDRDREIIRWNAWVGGGLDDFKKHPIILIGHDYSGLWVARVTKVEIKEDGLYFRAVFATTPAAQECWQLIKDTQTAAFSVGFAGVAQDLTVKALLPNERKSAIAAGLLDSDRVKVFTKATLFEISLVAVPACASALLVAFKAGKIKTKGLRDAIGAAVRDSAFLVLDDETRKYNSRGEREFDINNPAELKELLESALGHDNLKRIIGSRIKLALDKARGKVY